jgi:hypothetical protein
LIASGLLLALTLFASGGRCRFGGAIALPRAFLAPLLARGLRCLLGLAAPALILALLRRGLSCSLIANRRFSALSHGLPGFAGLLALLRLLTARLPLFTRSGTTALPGRHRGVLPLRALLALLREVRLALGKGEASGGAD